MKWLVSVLFLCLALMGAGCSVPDKQSSPGSYMVTDDAGRTVRLSHKPERIVSVTYGSDEILWELVSPSRIRAFSRYAGDPGISFITEEEKARVGHTVSGSLESVIAERPDLVFVTSGTGKEIIDSLDDMGVPVYVSVYPRTWKDMEKKIRGMAAAVREEERGTRLIAHMEEKKAAVEQKLQSILPGQEKTALALSFSGVVGKKGTLLANMMALARVKNEASLVPGEGDTAVFTKEAIVAADPDVLFLPTWNFNGRSDAGELKREILSDPAYANVKAVRNGCLVYVPDRYRYVTSHHAAEAIEVIARAAYPELWENEEMRN